MLRSFASRIGQRHVAVACGATSLTGAIVFTKPILWCEEPKLARFSQNSRSLEARARGSFGMDPERLQRILSVKSDFDEALQACARNVKMGPFTATSGMVLEYLLNAATSLLDKTVSMQISRMTLDVISANFEPARQGEVIFVIGGEMGGGVMAGQCCAVAPLTHNYLLSRLDFAYMRKQRKESGTLQQLEAPNHITSRTPESPAVNAIWLDECNSSGAELLKNVTLLKREYNIDVIGAVYLVDRSRDRKELAIEKLHMAHPTLAKVKVLALFDLEQIDPLITK